MLAAILTLTLSAALAEQGARYFVIVADSYVQAVRPLADWKTAKGVLAKVVPISQIGILPSQIQAYIRNAYNTWPVRPEYVLLAGSPTSIPSYGDNNDCYYGDMSGDQKMEISVGRFPAENLLTKILYKVLSQAQLISGSQFQDFISLDQTLR